MLGSGFGPVALAFGILGLPGRRATTLSVVLAATGLSQVLFFLFGGVIADRLPRYRVMVAAGVLAGLGIALFLPALTGVVPDVPGQFV